LSSQHHESSRNAANDGSTPETPATAKNMLSITYWPVEKLYIPPDMPRRFSRKERRAAVAILRRFGFRLPQLIQSDGRVIANMLAVMAATDLGIEQIPVVLADDLSKRECDELSIALARFYELGKFDQKLLVIWN
jgi:ParB-like chromosome segregation protein Spo0J